MIWLNVLRSQPLLFDQVPLSCVPPITSHDRNGLIATFSNCRVLLRLRSVWSSTTGALESSRLQPTLSAPVTGPPVAVAAGLVALRREVRERAAGADDPAVRPFEDLGRVARVHDDRVLVRVDPVGRPAAEVRWREPVR